MLDNLLKNDDNDYDERWLILDVDRYDQGNQQVSYRETLQTAKESGIQLAVSKPCFEVWLLLHHADESHVAELIDCKSVVSKLRTLLGEYNKNKLKAEYFTHHNVKDAMVRSRRLDKDDSLIPTANTTRVYQLWESITRNLDYWHLLLNS